MEVKAKVIPGYGAASGRNNDERYSKGTISTQSEHFRQRGLDLSSYFMGTLNVDISPYTYSIKTPKFFFKNINWSKYISPENFYFFDIELIFGDKSYFGLVYMPDPATKQEHKQLATTLELILPKIENLEYGAEVYLRLEDSQLKMM
ncbi:hypothetical protein U6A24_03710 [Aquimarina gracilis]|uniref:Uncharacterized protein n=1 Tax=Aquimarina gracilis TaxID=874422 RepID=A0ABU5ZTG1_9FLAO|nr:hypothetical protein [Aquimarina gracilis]MEB3344551.1 hypothetical protein [Aquimarina gracilis]